jgi:hypothetical protein
MLFVVLIRNVKWTPPFNRDLIPYIGFVLAISVNICYCYRLNLSAFLILRHLLSAYLCHQPGSYTICIQEKIEPRARRVAAPLLPSFVYSLLYFSLSCSINFFLLQNTVWNTLMAGHLGFRSPKVTVCVCMRRTNRLRQVSLPTRRKIICR